MAKKSRMIRDMLTFHIKNWIEITWVFCTKRTKAKTLKRIMANVFAGIKIL